MDESKQKQKFRRFLPSVKDHAKDKSSKQKQNRKTTFLEFKDHHQAKEREGGFKVKLKWEARRRRMGRAAVEEDLSGEWSVIYMVGEKKHVMAGIAIIGVLFGVPWYLMNRGSKHRSHQDYLERADKARSERLSSGLSSAK